MYRLFFCVILSVMLFGCTNKEQSNVYIFDISSVISADDSQENTDSLLEIIKHEENKEVNFYIYASPDTPFWKVTKLAKELKESGYTKVMISEQTRP